MNVRLLVLSFVMSMVLSSLVCAEEISITSKNIKSYLESKNLKVSASRTVMKAAEEREGSLARSFLPTVDLYGAQESFETGILSPKTQSIFGVEARLNIFNGGRDKVRNDVRLLETKKLEYQSQRIISEELEKARSLYWKILYTKEKQALLRASLEINKQNLKSAKRRIKGGVATDSDRFEFEMKEVDLTREITEAEVRLSSQVQFFKF